VIRTDKKLLPQRGLGLSDEYPAQPNMSTQTPSKAATTPAEKAPEELLDDQHGVYGWFRRHQKKLLYSVGMFVLLFFSVSGPMLATVQDFFNTPRQMQTVLVGERRVSLTPEDYDIGQSLANRVSVLAAVMPPINVGDGGRSELGEVYAWLRRVAITEGIDVSYTEVDRALEMLKEGGSVESLAQLARQYGFASLADCRQQFAEAMRIGTLLRLQTLALDNSDANIIKTIIGDREKITLRVATFDEKELDEKLKAEGGMSDDDLRAWLDGKEKPEKQRLAVFDTNRVALSIGALLFADFDRAEWADEYLVDFEVGDEQLQKVYNIEKERFKNEDDTYKTLEDEGVKEELTKLLEAEKVIGDIHRKLSEQRAEFSKEANDERIRCIEARTAAQNEVKTLEQKIESGPEDATLLDALRLEKEKLVALEAAEQAATEAYNLVFAGFDFAAAFAEMVKDKKGAVQCAFAEKRNEEQLGDLEENGLGLGKWPASRNATFHARKGDFSFGAQRSEKAAFVYQVTDVDVQPLKPWEDLQPLLEGAYFTEKAKEQAEAAKEQFEAALLRLAKAQIPDKVKEIESQRQSRIDEKLAEWEEKTNSQIADAKSKLADTRPGTQAQAAWQRKLEQLEARLTAKEATGKTFAAEVDKVLEEEIEDEALKLHKAVLVEAAAESGFEVEDIGPLPRNVSSRPRFDKRYDPTTVFMLRSQNELDEGEATGVVNDATNRRWHAGYCLKVEPLSQDDIERREFEQLRRGGGFGSFAAAWAQRAMSQAFTKEALKERYVVESPTGTQSVPGPADDGGEKPADDGGEKPADGR